MIIEFGPQKIDLGGETSAGSNGEGGDGNLSDGRGDGGMSRRRTTSSGGSNGVGGGEDRREGKIGKNVM